MIRELEFKVLCQRHSDEIYRYARSLLANASDAEDATQEVLLRLWNHLPTLRPFGLRSWLLQATRSYCLDQLRRRAHHATPISVDDEMLEEQPDHQALNPSAVADARMRLAQAHESLQRLPENLRSVFVLYEVNGLRYREIADTLGMPINSVKVYLSRAREKLAELLNQKEPWTKTCKE